jgi:deazaflavin-dependent oxidoreductase (nitroreductase family)
MDTHSRDRQPGRMVRWMYRTGRPNRLASMMNRVAAAIGSAGLWRSRMVTLEVRGRRTGRLISLPLVPVEYQGDRYLVAMLGPGTGWVANVRAAGGAAVLRAGSRTPVQLEEVDPASRAPILHRYVQVAPGARPHIPVDRHASAEAFEKVAAQLPVFRIRPATDTGSASPGK